MSKMVKIDEDVREVLLRATMTSTSVSLPDQLDRALYMKVDKVLKAAGGAWNRKAKAHLFATFDPRTMLADVATATGIENRQQSLQQFWTPQPIARRLVQIAEVKPGQNCLEPSAGCGAIADELRVAMDGQDPMLIEIDDLLVKGLVERGYTRVLCVDFLLLRPPQVFDRIVMNPPFTGGQDIAHVTRAFDFLAPDGVLVAIMSPSIDFRSTKAHVAFRKLLSAHGEIVERLPRGTFEDTEIETIIVRLQR